MKGTPNPKENASKANLKGNKNIFWWVCGQNNTIKKYAIAKTLIESSKKNFFENFMFI